MGILRAYESYNFRNKDPVIDRVRTMLQEEKVLNRRGQIDLRRINKDTGGKRGVSIACLYGWFSGKTRRPQHAPLAAVASAYDYDLVLMKRKKR